MKQIISKRVTISGICLVLYLCSTSAATYSVGYTILPPLLVGEYNDTLRGAGADVLNLLINRCLGKVTLEYTYYPNSEVLHSSFPTNTFTLPVARTTLMNGMLQNSNRFSFIQLVETPGPVVLISNKVRKGRVVKSVTTSWPLLVVVMTSASLSGVIIWILDRHANPKDFPKAFIRGTWEGFWWSLITMTTVGYGDKTPNSIQARVFSIFWILIGIVMVSIFTATLAASFTADEAALEDIRGLTVGVMRGSEEFISSLSAGATPVEYDNVTELLSDLEIGSTMEAAMFDSLRIMFLAEAIKKYDLEIVASLDRPCAYGVITNNLTAVDELCMYKMAYKSRYQIMRLIKAMMNLNEKLQPLRGGESTVKRIISPNLVCIYALLGAFLFLSLIFLAWEQICRCKKKIRTGKNVFKITISKKSDEEIEKQEMQEQHTDSKDDDNKSVKINIDRDLNDLELGSATYINEKNCTENNHIHPNGEKEHSTNNTQKQGTTNGQIKFASNQKET